MTAVTWLVPYQLMESGTTAQRCKAPARYLSDRFGWKTTVTSRFLSEEKTGLIAVPYEKGLLNPDICVISWGDCDEYGADWTGILDRARAAGQRVLMDLDDDPLRARGKVNPKLAETFRHVDGFLFSTGTLMRSFGPRLPKGGWEAPTAYDPSPYAWRRPVAEPPQKPVLGYRGGVQWHSRDVALLRMLRDVDCTWVHLGYDPYRWSCSDCGAKTKEPPRTFMRDGQMWTTDRCPCGGKLAEQRPLFERQASISRPVRRFRIHYFRNYARLLGAVAPSITLGVLPLETNNFTMCKTAIGAMEWSAVGVPWIASEQPEYLRAARGAEKCCIVRQHRMWPILVNEALSWESGLPWLVELQRFNCQDEWGIEKVSDRWAEILTEVTKIGRNPWPRVGRSKVCR